MRQFAIALLVASAVQMCGSARAEQALVDFAGYNTGGAEVRTLGWEFTLSQSVVVTHLGLWDYGADGLNHSHLVTIWSTGTVKTRLVEGTVPSGGAPGSAWRWVTVTPTTLAPGTYRIGAVYPIGGANPDPSVHDRVAGFADTVTTSGPVAYVRNVYVNSTNYPSSTFAPEEKGYFGPNFQFQNLVPEPGLVQLPVLIVLSGASLWFRRRQR